MHRIILMAGTIIASSMGFALAGLILGNAIRNARRPLASRKFANPKLTAVADVLDACLREITLRGYDTPELHRDDTIARLNPSGNNREIQ